MKLTIRLMSLCLLVSLYLPVFANVEPILDVKNRTSQTCLIKLEGMQNETFWIKLIDQAGTVLQSEKVEDQHIYKKLYNLKNLPSGAYILKVENSTKVMLQPIEITEERIIIEEDAKAVISKPTLNYHYPYVDLNMLHFSDETLLVYIKDQAGNILHQLDLKQNGSVTKRFNVAEIPAGDYTFLVNSNQLSYEQTFSVYRKNKANLIYEK